MSGCGSGIEGRCPSNSPQGTPRPLTPPVREARSASRTGLSGKRPAVFRKMKGAGDRNFGQRPSMLRKRTAKATALKRDAPRSGERDCPADPISKGSGTETGGKGDRTCPDRPPFLKARVQGAAPPAGGVRGGSASPEKKLSAGEVAEKQTGRKTGAHCKGSLPCIFLFRTRTFTP